MMTFKRFIHNVYYFVIIGMLLLCFYYVVLNFLDDDQLRFFAFTIDTIYLHWNTSFPAVTVCENFNGEKNWDLSEKYYGSDRNNKLDDLISDITFFNGKCYTCSLCTKELVCPSNFTDVASKYRSSCRDMIHQCIWNNKQIECCDAFLPLETEFGLCFAINSIHTIPAYGHRLIANRVTGPGILSFTTHEDVQIHVHASNEIPNSIEGDIKENIFYGTDKEIILKITEIVNDHSVKDVAINYRKCRFSWELDNQNFESIYNYYSHSTCSVECTMNIQKQFCNCTHHLMPRRKNNNKICDIEGLICLTNNFAKINALRRNCECLASCEEPEFNTLYSSPNEKFREEPGSLITISMIDLPKQRYVRRNVKTILDVVSGVCSLFFGISILSSLDYVLKIIKYTIVLAFTTFCRNRKIIIEKIRNLKK